MSDLTPQQMETLAQRADTQSLEQIAQSAPTPEGRNIARVELELERRGK